MTLFFYDTGCRIEAKILHNRVCQLDDIAIHMYIWYIGDKCVYLDI